MVRPGGPRRGSRHARRLLATLVALGCAAAAAVGTPAPARAADPVASGRPGDVVWWAPAPAPLTSARAWRIRYRSTTAMGVYGILWDMGGWEWRPIGWCR